MSSISFYRGILLFTFTLLNTHNKSENVNYCIYTNIICIFSTVSYADYHTHYFSNYIRTNQYPNIHNTPIKVKQYTIIVIHPKNTDQLDTGLLSSCTSFILSISFRISSNIFLVSSSILPLQIQNHS